MKDFHENKVSIIIPVHNSEKYLEECIESALNQTYPDIEIIAVDDGSTDNSLKILEKYSNKIKIIKIKHCYLPAALNQGLKIAKGEWIKRIDSDDVLYPDAVENLVSVGKNIEDKKNTVLFGHVDIINSTGKIIRKRIYPNYNKLENFDLNIILLDHMIATPESSLFHRSTFEEYGMYDDESRKIGSDRELWLRYCLLHGCRLHLIPKIIAKYRIHPSQITMATRKERANNQNQTNNSILEKLNPKDRLLYEKALSRYRKNKPLNKKFWEIVQNNIIFNLPLSISTRIVIVGRSLPDGFKKVLGLSLDRQNL